MNRLVLCFERKDVGGRDTEGCATKAWEGDPVKATMRFVEQIKATISPCNNTASICCSTPSVCLRSCGVSLQKDVDAEGRDDCRSGHEYEGREVGGRCGES